MGHCVNTGSKDYQALKADAKKIGWKDGKLLIKVKAWQAAQKTEDAKNTIPALKELIPDAKLIPINTNSKSTSRYKTNDKDHGSVKYAGEIVEGMSHYFFEYFTKEVGSLGAMVGDDSKKHVRAAYSYTKKKLKELEKLGNDNLFYALRKWDQTEKLHGEFLGTLKMKIKDYEDEFGIEETDADNLQESLNNKALKTNSKKSASSLTRILVATAPETIYNDEHKPELVYNDLGLPKLVNFRATYSMLVNELSNSLSLEEIADKLQALADRDVHVARTMLLRSHIGKPINTVNEFHTAVQFGQAMSMYKNEFFITITNADGSQTEIDLLSDVTKEAVKRDWKTNEDRNKSEEYRRYYTADGKYNPQAFIDTFGKRFTRKGDTLKFLKRLGIDFTDSLYEGNISPAQNEEIDKIASRIYSYLTTKEEYDKDPRLLNSILRDDKNTNNSQNLSKLIDIALEAVPLDFNEHSVFNINGDKIYANSLFNYLTATLTKINNIKSKEDYKKFFPHLVNDSYSKNSLLKKKMIKGELSLKQKIINGNRTEGNENSEEYSKLINADRFIGAYRQHELGYYAVLRPESNKQERFLNTGKLANDDTVVEVFMGYLEDELSFLSTKRDNTDYVESGIVLDVISLSNGGVQKELIDKALNGESFQESIEVNRDIIESAIEAYIENGVKDLKDDFSKGELLKVTGVTEVGLKDFLINDTVSKIEQTKILIGNPAQYGDPSGLKMFKRLSMAVGTKDTTFVGEQINSLIDKASVVSAKLFSHFGRKFDNEIVDGVGIQRANGKKEGDVVVRIAPTEDVSVYTDQFNDADITDEEKKLYNNMDEGDGIGWITMDERRRMLIRSGEWKMTMNEHEGLYQWEIQNAMGIDSSAMIFIDPVTHEIKKGLKRNKKFVANSMKAQGFGSISMSNLEIGGQKCSFFELSPSSTEGKNTNVVRKQLNKQKVGIKLNKTGIKVSGPTVANKPYNSKGEVDQSELSYQEIPYQNIGVQLKTGTSIKDKVTTGTQMMKQVLSNLFAFGKPSSLIKKAKEHFDKFTGANNRRIAAGIEVLKEELGIVYEEGSFKIKKGERFRELALEEINRRELPYNAKDGLDRIVTNVTFNIESLINRKELEHILSSIADSEVMRQKRKGRASYQVAPTFQEDEGVRREFVILDSTTKKVIVEDGIELSGIKDATKYINDPKSRYIVRITSSHLKNYEAGKGNKSLLTKLNNFSIDVSKTVRALDATGICDYTAKKTTEFLYDSGVEATVVYFGTASPIDKTQQIGHSAALFKANGKYYLLDHPQSEFIKDEYFSKEYTAHTLESTFPNESDLSWEELYKPKFIKETIIIVNKKEIKVKLVNIKGDEVYLGENEDVYSKGVHMAKIGKYTPRVIPFTKKSLKEIYGAEEFRYMSGGWTYDVNGKETIVPVQRAEEAGYKLKGSVDFNFKKLLTSVDLFKTVSAMQVGVPSYFKGKIDIDRELVDEELLKLIGFRIPTQALSSIEAIEPVWLPESYGDTVILPTEIVAKSGADYDIDKLSLYIPNFYYDTEGQPVYIESMDQYKEYKESARVEALEALLSKLKDVLELTPFVRTTLTEAANEAHFNEGMFFDEILANISFKIKQDASLQRGKNKESLNKLGFALSKLMEGDVNLRDKAMSENKFKKLIAENELTEAMADIILDPQNFDNLTTPISTSIFKKLADDINPKNIMNKLSDVVNISKVMALQQQFIEGEDAISKTALAGTFHIFAQQYNFYINKEFKNDFGEKILGILNLDNNEDDGVVRLGGLTNKAGESITKLHMQWVNASVDNPSDLVLKKLNAGSDTLNVWLFLTMAGVPIETITYFMNQPIIIRHLNNRLAKSSHIAKITAKNKKSLGRKAILQKTMIEGKVGKMTEKGKLVLPATVEKKISLGQLKVKDPKIQGQVLVDFLRYEEIASAVVNAQQALSYDNRSIGKNPSELLLKHINTQKELDRKAIGNLNKAIDYSVKEVTAKERSVNTAEGIYNKIGSVTKSENVEIVSNPNSYLEQQNKGEAVVAYRGGEKNKNFGNPFADQSKSTKENVTLFIDFILNSDKEQAVWIREQLRSGKFKGKPIYYGNTRANKNNEPAHATALDYLINKYTFGVEQPQEVIASTKKKTINVYWGQSESEKSTKILSNLAPREFVYKGEDYMSVEHAYQVWKTGIKNEKIDNKYRALMVQYTPESLAGLPASQLKIADRSATVAQMKAADSLGLMKELVVESFKQNPNSAASKKLVQYENFTHNTNQLIDKAFLEGLKLAQKELEGSGVIVEPIEQPQEVVEEVTSNNFEGAYFNASKEIRGILSAFSPIFANNLIYSELEEFAKRINDKMISGEKKVKIIDKFRDDLVTKLMLITPYKINGVDYKSIIKRRDDLMVNDKSLPKRIRKAKNIIRLGDVDKLTNPANIAYYEKVKNNAFLRAVIVPIRDGIGYDNLAMPNSSNLAIEKNIIIEALEGTDTLVEEATHLSMLQNGGQDGTNTIRTAIPDEVYGSTLEAIFRNLDEIAPYLIGTIGEGVPSAYEFMFKIMNHDDTAIVPRKKYIGDKAEPYDIVSEPVVKKEFINSNIKVSELIKRGVNPYETYPNLYIMIDDGTALRAKPLTVFNKLRQPMKLQKLKASTNLYGSPAEKEILEEIADLIGMEIEDTEEKINCIGKK